MKKCSICKKNIAVIYTTRNVNGKDEVIGLCMECAKKMGLPVMNQMMQQINMSPEDIENLSEQISNMFEDMNIDNIDLQDKDAENQMATLFSNFTNMGKQVIDSKNEQPKGSKSLYNEKKVEVKEKSKKKKKYLDKFGINLIDKAMNNQVDRIIGRHREIDRVIQILNRRNKNNPILIGEPGVGKTAIAEGLAVRIVENQVPVKLLDMEIYLLDMTAVVAGTQFRGQFEGRMKSIIDEAVEYGNIILVIDEVHNIVGAGEVNGGAMNAANILKPALARGEIKVIGTTTIDEYRKHIEKDAALERRFQPVLVDESTVEETIEILNGVKKYYEDYHKVKISEEVVEEAVKLSERYITDRYLPDKAIDVIDEAGSRANLKNEGFVELEALKEELKKVQEEKENAASIDDYEKAAEFKMNEINIEGKIKEIEKRCNEVEITVDDIAYVIEAWTQIPVQKITEKEAKKLLSLEERLHKRVIGQEEGVQSLSRAIRRNRSGFKKRKKPSSFIFVGPTGVGKTELARSLAYELFGSEEAMIRLDMSEYMEKHTVSKLIGAPPGYIGFDQGGQLTEKVRRKPYSVILMDEIEKAHPDVFNMLLQILEDGRLTDSEGRTVYFENTVIIMTSNVGTNFKTNSIGFGKDNYDAIEVRIKDELKQTFRPEFLNRVDEIVVFTHLTKDELRKIIDLMFKEIYHEVKDKGMNIDISEDVKDFILEKGFDSKFGARPLRRVIQRYIEDEIAEEYLKNSFKEGQIIKVALEKGKIVIK